MKIALFALAVAVAVLVDGASLKDGGIKERLDNFAAKFPKGSADGAAPFDFKKFTQGLMEKGRAVYEGITGLDDKIDVHTFLENLGGQIRSILEKAQVPAVMVEKIVKKQAEEVETFVKKSGVVPTVGEVVNHLKSALSKAESHIDNIKPTEALEHFKKNHSERTRRSAEDSNDEDDASNDNSNDDSSSQDVDTKKGKTNTQGNGGLQDLIKKVRDVINGVDNLQDKLDVDKFVKVVFGRVKDVLKENGIADFFIGIVDNILKDEVKKFVKQSTGKETVGDAVKYINAKVDELIATKKDAEPVAAKQPIRKARSAEESGDDEDEDVDEDSASSEDVESKKGKKDKTVKKEKKEKKAKKHGKNQDQDEEEDATNTRERRAAGENRKHGGAGQRNNTAGSENKSHRQGHGHHGKGNNSTSTDAGANQPRGKFDFATIAQAFGGIKGNHTKGGKGKHSRP